MNQAPRKYLVISPTGADVSFHTQWTSGNRLFDLMLVNYGTIDQRYKQDCELYYQMRGFKLEILAAAISAFAARISEYEAVWLPDDDLSIDTAQIDKLFQLHTRFNLDLSQPSVTGPQFHPTTRHHPGLTLRYVNFVEMMCPLFRTSTLFELLDTFTSNRSGFGVDWLWSKRLAGRKIAVIDAVSVEHTKPVSQDGPYYRALREQGIDAEQEYVKLMFTHDLSEEYHEFERIPLGAQK